MTATDHARKLALAAAQAAADKLATDITLIDVSDQLVITDVFVIVSAANDRQVAAVVDAIEEALRRLDTKPLRREGEREGLWVLLDYADVVVHVQQNDARVLYALERLWSDCPTIAFDDSPFLDRAFQDGDPAAHDSGAQAGSTQTGPTQTGPTRTGGDAGPAA